MVVFDCGVFLPPQAFSGVVVPNKMVCSTFYTPPILIIKFSGGPSPPHGL
jgi:hypothetical protein